jgi:hypothetical protein
VKDDVAPWALLIALGCALLLLPILTGCGTTLYLGAGAHAVRHDAPEIDGEDNPLGYIRIEAPEWHRVHLECQHVSSLPRLEDGYGFNGCAGMLRVWGRR